MSVDAGPFHKIGHLAVGDAEPDPAWPRLLRLDIAERVVSEAAARSFGVALVPVSMFEREMQSGRIVQPFPVSIAAGSHWLARLKSRPETASMRVFRRWLIEAVAET